MNNETVKFGLNATVLTTTVEQTANEILNTNAKTLYYLIISTPKGALTINIGEKTHKKICEITDIKPMETKKQK